MKELPYFKFYVNEWLSGDIELLSFEAQGVFIRLCSYYWSKECVMKLERSKKRFKGFEDAFDELIDEGIIKIEDDYIKISFLDSQLNEREYLSKTNSANGKKGGRPKKKPIESEEKPIALNSESEEKPIEKPIESESKANQSNIEEKRREKKRKEDIINDIYSLYPTNCPVKGKPNGKGKANKEQIKRILKSKEETVDSLKAKIERYVRECKNSNTYLKNFKTFLNNLPDYSEEEKKDELKEENIYLWIKKQLEEEPKKTFNSSYINSLRHKEMKLSEEEFKELSKMNNLKAERLRFAK
jgi:hypothetical protein